jgi:hypothetical protein
MGTTSEELKKLYRKLGGRDANVRTVSAPGDIINAINELPIPVIEVTDPKKGEVLTYDDVDGKFKNAPASGGGAGSHVGILSMTEVENSVSQTEVTVEVVPGE